MSVKLRKRELPSGTKQLYLAINVNGYRTYESLNFYLGPDKFQNKETLRLAETIRAKRELEVHTDSEGLADRSRRRQNFYAFAEQVYDGKKPHTKQTYINTMKHLKDFAGKDLTVARLTTKFCEQFLAHLNKDLKPNSAAAYYARFKTIVRALVREGIISQDPAIGVLVNRVASLPKYLTLEELLELKNKECGNIEVRDAFLFSCYTGLRYQDISTLSWKQVRGETLGYTQSKTGAEEIIPLSPSAMSLLERRRGSSGGTPSSGSSDGLVFSLPRRSTVDKVLKTWGKRGGLSIPLSFHKARHTFATLALDADVDLYTTSKLLGHKSIATSQVYARVTDSKKKAAVAKLPKIE